MAIANAAIVENRFALIRHLRVPNAICIFYFLFDLDEAISNVDLRAAHQVSRGAAA